MASKQDSAVTSSTLWFGIERKWWTLAMVGIGTFMSALDGSVVNIALPVIGKTTGSPVSTIEWVVLIYLITVSSTLLVFGRLADIYGKRRIYISGQVIFTLGSLLCGLSGGIGLLIVSRAIQAMGAAMNLALSPGVITAAFPGKERGRALGMQATVTYLGLSTGPALGGFLTQHFGWPSIFFINVPIGAIAILVAYRVLRRDEASSAQPFDPAGAATMAIALSSLLFALSKGPGAGWGSPLILGLLGLSAIAAVMFVTIERRVAHPALDFRLFSNWMFSASIITAFLCYCSQAAVSFLMPFYLLHANGFAEAKAGLIMMSTPIAMMFLTGPSGYLSDRIGAKLPATLGMLVMAAGMFCLHWLTPGAPPSHIVPYAILIGIGAGLFTSPNNSAIMGSAPRDRQGVAGAILAAARTTGFASGVALAGVIYVSRVAALHTLPEPVAITSAVRTGMWIITCVALAGAFLSVVRGKHGDGSRKK